MKTGEKNTEGILSGKLKKGTLEYLLKKAHNNKLTGNLSINGREGFGVIMLRDGRIVSVTSPTMKDMLTKRLIEKGVLTEDQINIALENQKKITRKQLESVFLKSSQEDKLKFISFELFNNL